ncbi:MAG: 50S ribosomal protein L18 [Chloroflexi bacterium]|nr:50S ribosomal protein L18 [Chloroflexota bacterium]
MAIDRHKQRKKRHLRVRTKLSGTADRPRLNVFRSSKHIYAQVIDDDAGHTIASASTVDLEMRPELEGKTKIERAKAVGRMVALRAKEYGVSNVVFDRGGFRYQGRIKALAEAAREAGLQF